MECFTKKILILVFLIILVSCNSQQDVSENVKGEISKSKAITIANEEFMHSEFVIEDNLILKVRKIKLPSTDTDYWLVCYHPPEDQNVRGGRICVEVDLYSGVVLRSYGFR